jgi:hypothetical protein
MATTAPATPASTATATYHITRVTRRIDSCDPSSHAMDTALNDQSADPNPKRSYCRVYSFLVANSMSGGACTLYTASPDRYARARRPCAKSVACRAWALSPSGAAISGMGV